MEAVLESLTPVEANAGAPGRRLFEPEDLEQQLDQLMGDIAVLRERVQHLVSLVPEVAVPREPPAPLETRDEKKKHTSKHRSKPKKHGRKKDRKKDK